MTVANIFMVVLKIDRNYITKLIIKDFFLHFLVSNEKVRILGSR